MSTVEKLSIISQDDYLAGELCSEVRHEYVAGQIFAMVGGAWAHNVITGNVFTALHNHLRGKPCRVFMSDMKVKSEKANAYYYPDVVVSCETPSKHATFLEEPVLIIEVLSASTESIDRREKRFAYQAIRSLQEYVLIHQNKRKVEIYRSETESSWQLETYEYDEKVFFKVADLDVPMELIYA